MRVVFGEFATKSFAIARSDGISLFVAPFMRAFYYPFLPGIVVFDGTANAVVRLSGAPPSSEVRKKHSEEEIRAVFDQSVRQGGVLELEEGAT